MKDHKPCPFCGGEAEMPWQCRGAATGATLVRGDSGDGKNTFARNKRGYVLSI